ncbi:MAG: S41 family peptidase [Proteobacteria bacterium]|nr:S41 family peptidase [Pseudomonadota bacterium]
MSRQRKSGRRSFVIVGVVAALMLSLGTVFFGNEVSAKDSSSSAASGADLYDELKVFTDVLAIVQRDYVRPVDNKKIVEGAIKGMLATLDPHSGYLDPDFYKDLQVQTKGEFGGLGIEITIKDGLLVIVAPMEGSPAESAGLRAGDSIVKIDGKFTKDFSLVDAVKRMRGPKGSPIVLSVYRKGVSDLIDVTVVRDNIQVRSVKSRFLGDGIGYVRVSQFMEKTFDDLRSALKNIEKKNGSSDLKGLILDLRNNPGGLLTQAVKISDLFLSDGVIVYTDGRIDNQRQKFYAHSRGTEPNYPMVVLINGGSASASEIVSGALQDAARAIVVGTQSFGKGSVQTITPLENGGALTLTTALYYTKSGRSIQVTGVKPDVEVQPSPEEELEEPVATPAPKGLRQGIREGDLPGAIENPTLKESPDSADALRKINKTPTERADLTTRDPEKEDIEVWIKRDPQFAKAIDLLKGFNVLNPTAANSAVWSSGSGIPPAA